MRTARWISPLRGQSPWLLFDPLVPYAQLSTDVLPMLPFRWFPWCMWHACEPLRCCGTSSPGPKFTAESKVRWSSVISFCTLHSCSARQVSTLSFSALWSPNSLILYSWSPNSLILHPWSPNSLKLQPLLAPPLLREFATYLVSAGHLWLLLLTSLTSYLPLLPLLRETFKSYILVSGVFLHILAFESLWCSCRFPRRSLVDPSMLPRRF